MRNNTEDKTLERNYLSKWRFLISEYLLVKQKRHSQFKFVSAFYKHHGTNRQTFLKYYNRYLDSGDENSLKPQKRGPKYKTGKPIRFIENKVIEVRKKGINKYDIHIILKEQLKQFTPSPSGIYNILRRYNLNVMTPKIKEKKRKIIKTIAGELGHIDCHYLSKDIIFNSKKRYYLVAVVDSYTRVLWAEVIDDIKSLTVMFSVLRIFNMLKDRYDIQFQEMLTDNGPEFGSGKNAKNKLTNPFERMLLELEVKHRYTRPYRPQTNGKIERFWRTLEDELIEGAVYESIEEFRDELLHYLVYYNEHRPHQSLGGETPQEFNDSNKTEKCQRNG